MQNVWALNVKLKASVGYIWPTSNVCACSRANHLKKENWIQYHFHLFRRVILNYAIRRYQGCHQILIFLSFKNVSLYGMSQIFILSRSGCNRFFLLLNGAAKPKKVEKHWFRLISFNFIPNWKKNVRKCWFWFSFKWERLKRLKTDLVKNMIWPLKLIWLDTH